MNQQRIKKLTCLVYGEGRKDKKFLIALIDLENFRYRTQKWHFSYDNGSGGSPEDILEKCYKGISNFSYDLVICFIDLDKLKQDFPKNWENKKIKIDKKYQNRGVEIIWQIDNLEDEFIKVLGKNRSKIGKKEINKLANKEIAKFINSEFWKRILGIIIGRENDLLT